MVEDILGAFCYRKVGTFPGGEFHHVANPRQQSVRTSTPTFNQFHWPARIYDASH